MLIHFCGNVFTDPLLINGNTENTVSSNVALVSVNAETGLPRHCLVVATSFCSTIPAFSHHVTILLINMLHVLNYNQFTLPQQLINAQLARSRKQSGNITK
jgi:hypothetical protein